MKLSIELGDDELRNLVNTQVKRAISEMTTEAIQAEVEKILGIKFERINEARVDEALQNAAHTALAKYAPLGAYTNNKYQQVLTTAATQLIKAGATK